MNIRKLIKISFSAVIGTFMAFHSVVEAAAVSQVAAQLPLFVNNSVPPLNMLVVGRDHKLFFPAYNDASDLDGDGSIDIRYKPTIDYLGYFDSYKCYTYSSSNGYYSPTSTTTNKKCSGNWSGDYLNYLTTSRADALRKVLYGGYRYVDTTSQTILSRAYIPMDAHTWGKEYTSLSIDGYNLSDYTPYANPTTGNYTLFANTSLSTTTAPLLRVLSNKANMRIFGWVSREVTQGGTTITNTSFQDVTVVPDDYAVRVEVCKTGFLESNCKLYPNATYKPTGILHDYGEGNQMYFGLLTGTYTNNIQGGALRKAMGSFASEIDANTGIFGVASTSGGTTTYTKQAIIGTLDALRIPTSTCSGTNTITNATCAGWGNPLGEMMFETMRYFSGATTPTSGYTSGSTDTTYGLPTAPTTWTDPYSSTPNASPASSSTNPTFPYCSKPFETLFSDVNPNYDSDLPGSAFTTTNLPGSIPSVLSSFSVATQGQTIWDNDVGGSKSVNIGETVSTADTAPTAKTASSFGNIRGLPEEPTKQGTFNAAAVAYYANTNPITSLGSQKVQTFSIALSSTLPRIQMPVGTGTITVLPFGKVTSGVTEQLTGFYIDSLYNMPGQPQSSSVNGGRAQAIFRVVFDDCGQGCDYDMDAIVLYTIAVNAAGTLDVTLQTVYSVSGAESHMGYTISGTTHDGIYIEVTGGGSTGATHYALDTPGTSLPGACAVSPSPCTTSATLLPGMKSGSIVVNGSASHTRNFSASSSTSITNLQNPLWYAAKWGGFGDSTNTASSLPVTGQWDSNTSGTPNNYFLVTNASTLKTQLAKAFNQILQKNSSVAAPATSQALGTSNTYSTYVNSLNIAYWNGDLTKSNKVTTTTGTTTTTSTIAAWTASSQMPAWGLRNVKMATAAGNGLQNFTYSNLATRKYGGTALQSSFTANMVNFLLGDTSLETSTYRKRASLIGDLVNSSPVVVSTAQYVSTVADSLDGTSGTYGAFKTTQASRRPQVYVGANDGMLHAFDASTGVEKFAFIPTAVISNLPTLASTTYNSDSSQHKYYVDGTPVVADVYFGSAWHTVLVGTLGAGGREIFALDITDPDNISLLWEFTALQHDSVTSNYDADLGYTLSTPVIAKLHTGAWGVIVGNGYSGNNGTASLLVLNVATGATISKLATNTSYGGSGNNGLSSPVILDENSDGIADFAYAGDLQGNMWRFDLTTSGSLAGQNAAGSDFAVSFGNTPLYSATVSDTSGSAVQSITATPTVVTNPTKTGSLVIFGTGRYFATADKTSTDLQTMYGIWDKTTSPTTTGGTTVAVPTSTATLKRANLQVQTITSQTSGTFGSTTQVVRTVSANTVDWTSKYGWYLDLKVGSTLLGERITDPVTVSGQVLLASTRTPSTDVCTPGITGWIYGLNPNTGGSTTFPVFNLSRTGTVSSSTDNLNGAVVSSYSSSAGGTSTISTSSDTDTTNSDCDSAGNCTVYNPGSNSGGRQTWRIIPTN